MDPAKMKETARRMTDARALLVKENPFFGHLALRLKPACAPCGTACTDGTRLIFDPEFAEKLSDQEMLFVILHEVLHCALDHCSRGKGLDNRVHNIACDIVVNSMILEMWGMDTFTVAGEEVMHRAPDGREGKLFSSEEVYQMLLKSNSVPDDGDGIPGIDRHDLWQGISDPLQLSAVWTGQIAQAAISCGNTSAMPQAVRDVAEAVMYRSKLDWRQLLHDFLQHDSYDYTFCPPDRRYADGDFFLPSYDIDGDVVSAKDLWVCVDTSASISDELLSRAIAEILDAMRQAGLQGMISFFDSTITDPVPFFDAGELRKITPTGGGGTSFTCIFTYMKEYMVNHLPQAILIFTDGFAFCPKEEAAMEVPVLWMVRKGGFTDLPWGRVTVVE